MIFSKIIGMYVPPKAPIKTHTIKIKVLINDIFTAFAKSNVIKPKKNINRIQMIRINIISIKKSLLNILSPFCWPTKLNSNLLK